MLTPSDIEQKTFSTALRGYDLDEVDDFLDEVVAAMRELHDQMDAARTAAVATPVVEQPEALSAVPPEPERAPAAVDEGAIGRALLAAQTAADKLVEDAATEAARIVDEARGEADSWTAERDEKQREAEAQIEAFATRVASIRSELSVLAGQVAHKLDDMDAVIAGAPTVEDTGPTFDDETTDGGSSQIGGSGEKTTDEVTDGGTDGWTDGFNAGDVPTEEPDLIEDALTGVANDLQLDVADDNRDFDVSAFDPHNEEE